MAETKNSPANFHVQTLGVDGGEDSWQLIWLHGWGQSLECFLPLAKLFEREGQNFLFDLPGFGKTPMLESGAGTEDYAKALIPQLEKLPLRPRIIIGHSFGCRVATQLAFMRPDLMDGVIYIAGAGVKRKRSVGFKLRAKYLKTLGKIAGLVDRIFRVKLRVAYAQKFGSADYKNAGEMRATFVSVVNEDLAERASKITHPALLIYGDEDNETPPEMGEKYNSVMPNSSLKVLKGYGHLDILSHGAHQCQNHINKFLKGVMAK
jgi:pimeloyl-ACP methyl ester carboxylesterase